MVLLELNGKEERRAYSISSSPHEKGYIDLTIKLEENSKGGSIKLHQMKEHDQIKIQGPYGIFIPDDSVKHAVMIASGSGIAPFRSMWRHRLENKLGTTDVLFSAKSKDELIFYDELQKLEGKDFHAHCTITRETPDGWKGGIERLTIDTIKQHCKAYKDSIFYLCGAPQFCEAMKVLLLQDKVPLEKVKMEKYW
jgi:ferredoxin-NADP reductase